ncbi:hypothetical protein RNI52_00360, partial [Labrys neptuniae]
MEQADRAWLEFIHRAQEIFDAAQYGKLFLIGALDAAKWAFRVGFDRDADPRPLLARHGPMTILQKSAKGGVDTCGLVPLYSGHRRTALPRIER